MENNRRDKLKEIIAHRCDRKNVAEGDRLFDALGFSSLETMLVILEIEEELGIRLDYSALRGIETVGQLVDVCENSAKASSDYDGGSQEKSEDDAAFAGSLPFSHEDIL